MRKSIKVLSVDDTIKIGEAIGRRLDFSFPILLFGDLGAGKTVFVRGLAKGMGSPSRVKSPSFTILYIYRGGKFDIYHFDLYRLTKEGISDLFVEGYFDKEGIIVVEWAEKLFSLDYFPCYLRVDFSFTGETERVITFSSNDERIENLIIEVSNEYIRD